MMRILGSPDGGLRVDLWRHTSNRALKGRLMQWVVVAGYCLVPGICSCRPSAIALVVSPPPNSQRGSGAAANVKRCVRWSLSVTSGGLFVGFDPSARGQDVCLSRLELLLALNECPTHLLERSFELLEVGYIPRDLCLRVGVKLSGERMLLEHIADLGDFCGECCQSLAYTGSPMALQA